MNESSMIERVNGTFMVANAFPWRGADVLEVVDTELE